MRVKSRPMYIFAKTVGWGWCGAWAKLMGVLCIRTSRGRDAADGKSISGWRLPSHSLIRNCSLELTRNTHYLILQSGEARIDIQSHQTAPCTTVQVSQRRIRQDDIRSCLSETEHWRILRYELRLCDAEQAQQSRIIYLLTGQKSSDSSLWKPCILGSTAR